MSAAKRSRWLLVGAVVLALAGGAYVGVTWVRGLWSERPIPTYTVERQRFTRTVSAEGNLRAVKATPITPSPRGGRAPLKIMWLADDGTHVEEGDVVVRFDPSEWQKKLEDGQSALTTAEKKIAKERILVGTAQGNRDRESAMSRRELEQTQRFQRKNATIFSRNEIIESEIDEAYSRAKMEHAQAAKGIESSLSRSKLELLAIEKRTAEQQIAQAQAALEGLVVTAPHAGIFVLKRDWQGNEPRVGDQIWPGQGVAEIPHTGSMEAEVFVLESDAGGLVDGLAAEVVIEAHPETSYAAKIQRVDKLAKPRVRGVPVQYFGVVLALETTDTAIMKPGQRVRASLTVDQREALVVPRPAVFEKDGKTVVYRQLEGGGFEPVEVVIGASTPGLLVIDQGLSEGDRIALRDPSAGRAGASDGEAGEGQGAGQSGTAGATASSRGAR